MTETSPSLLQLTAQIVSAHCGCNTVPTEDLSTLIHTVYAALSSIDGRPEDAAADGSEALTPAVPIKKSVFPDYIVCLEDGKKLKMLKRHLQTSFGLTPAQYRERWKLPQEYPMVAPNYATRRSVLARESGLGRKPDAQDGS